MLALFQKRNLTQWAESLTDDEIKEKLIDATLEESRVLWSEQDKRNNDQTRAQ